ncbi:MAG: glutamine synthetase type III, partial [Synechococcaceae bacterium WB4_1_0192]|nr:glutamine synthetase type III [Synechococcaceae bacterium WB4_1_0192]
VIFGGDGYSSEWHELAVRERGLENLRTSADALPVLQRPEIRELFVRQNVLSPVELESRFEVYAEQYCLAIEVEAKLALRIARTTIYPAVSAYLSELAGSIQEQEAIGLTPSKALAQQIGGLSAQLLERCDALEAALASAPHGAEPHMRHCADVLMVRMGELRQAVDTLETLVDDAAWPLPTYQEMLFVR